MAGKRCALPRTSAEREHSVIAMTIGFLSWRAFRLTNLATLLDDEPCYLPLCPLGEFRALAGWGRKRNANAARWLAERLELPFLTLEDGFLRSITRDDRPLSLIVDNEGIYYNAKSASKLERLICESLDEEQTARSVALIDTWKQTRVSKYNHQREYKASLSRRFVIVCDQTFDDASIRYGLASPESFTNMLDAALAEYPKHTIILKTHPDVVTRGKKGHFD